MFDKPEEFNPKIKKTFAKFMMRFIDCFLVRNDVPLFGKLSKKIRCFLARRISKGIEKGAVIEKGAIIVPGVVCESRGCIGIKCVTCWGLHIGKHTMMGPDCRFYSISHKRAEEGKFAFKGFEKPRPIYIGQDCWIGYNVVVTGGGCNQRRSYHWSAFRCYPRCSSVLFSGWVTSNSEKTLSSTQRLLRLI